MTSPESKMAERDVSSLIFCFFPSLLSSELVFFFTEPKLNASFQGKRLKNRGNEQGTIATTICQ